MRGSPFKPLSSIVTIPLSPNDTGDVSQLTVAAEKEYYDRLVSAGMCVCMCVCVYTCVVCVCVCVWYVCMSCVCGVCVACVYVCMWYVCGMCVYGVCVCVCRCVCVCVLCVSRFAINRCVM